MADSINSTTMNALKTAIQAGLTNSETIGQITNRIDVIYDNKPRSKMIARSEVIRANNLGHLEGYKQSGVVDFKEWVTAMDERTCEFCLRMEKEFAVKTLDQNYLNKYDELLGLEGGVLKIDYASLSAPPLHPNCRCAYVPFCKSWEELPLDDNEFSKSARKLLGGDIPKTRKWEEWFLSRTEGVQKKILGETRFNLWKARAVEIKDLSVGSKVVPLVDLIEAPKVAKKLKEIKKTVGQESSKLKMLARGDRIKQAGGKSCWAYKGVVGIDAKRAS